MASALEPSRSANRTAAGRRPAAATCCMRSKWRRSPIEVIVAIVAIPAAGFAIIAVPASRPAASRIRRATRGTPVVRPRPVPAEANDSAAASRGDRSSTMSRNDGSTSSRNASRPPGVSASTNGPSPANVTRCNSVVLLPNRQRSLARIDSGPKQCAPIANDASSSIGAEREPQLVGHISPPPHMVDDPAPLAGVAERRRHLRQRGVVGQRIRLLAMRRHRRTLPSRDELIPEDTVRECRIRSIPDHRVGARSSRRSRRSASDGKHARRDDDRVRQPPGVRL